MSFRGSTTRKVLAMLAAVGAGVLMLSAPAWSAQSETQQGAQLAAELHAGRLSGANLSPEQYTRVGQYLMSRAFSSTEAYEAMVTVMDRMMGTNAADRMYRYLGERYSGKNVAPEGANDSMYGWMGSMMRSYGGSSPYAGMMGAYLSGQVDRSAGTTSNPSLNHPMGPGMMRYDLSSSASSSGGWPTAAVLAVAILGALLIAGVLAVALPKLRGRRNGSATPAPGQT